jgi:hypothetical protein
MVESLQGYKLIKTRTMLETVACTGINILKLDKMLESLQEHKQIKTGKMPGNLQRRKQIKIKKCRKACQEIDT